MRTSLASRVSRALGVGEFAPLRIVAYGSYWAWGKLAYGSPSLTLGAADPVRTVFPAYMISAVMNLVTTVVYLLLARERSDRRALRAFVPIGPVLAAGGTLLTPLGGMESGVSTPLVVGSIMTGVGTAMLVLLIAEALASVNAKRASVDTALSWILASGLYFVAAGRNTSVALLLTAILPVICGAAIALRRSACRKDRVAYHRRVGRALPRGVLLLLTCLFLYSAVYQLTVGLVQHGGRLVSFGGIQNYARLGGLVAAVLVLIGSLVFSRGMSLGFTYRPLLPVTVVGLLSIPLLGVTKLPLALAFLGAGNTYMFIITWIVLSDLVHRLGLSATRVFGATQIAFVSGYVVGDSAAYALGSQRAIGASQLTVISIVVAVSLVLLVSLVLNESRVISGWGLQDALVDDDRGPSEGGRWKRRCQELAHRGALSARETEIMIMIAKGRNAPYICDTLHIAKGTLQTHTKHIYAKLDVHSQQELIDAIECASDANWGSPHLG